MGAAPDSTAFAEIVRIEGHIIDSLILPKVLDLILLEGGAFHIVGIEIGRQRHDTSWAEIRVSAPDAGRLQRILRNILPHGAEPIRVEDCQIAVADIPGTFPEGFYSSTNLETEIRVDGRWVPVGEQEMDCGIVLSADHNAATCVPMHRVQTGQTIVLGHRGVRVKPQSRSPSDPEMFQFMNSAVSSEKPKTVAVRDIAACFRQARSEGKRILLVGGPAIVHTGAGDHVCRLIRNGYIQVLFAGNALAAHDIEQAMFNTSLGVDLDRGGPVNEGHEHHLRAINSIRRCGGIRQAVGRGLLKSGIMYECVRSGVDFLLAGSIRDDGPLPDVITDVVVAADRMRELRRDLGFCLMVATTLHSIATGNILPASVRIACVDINPATVTKLADRGTAQSLGIVSDVEPFVRALVNELLGDGP